MKRMALLNPKKTTPYKVQYPKRTLKRSDQSIISRIYPILTVPVGYPDEFYPEKVHLITSKRLQMESLLLFDMIQSESFKIKDITILSQFRKDSFYTIVDKISEHVVFLAHKKMLANFRLPFYKGNPTILENGFKVKIKDLHNRIALMIIRKPLHLEEDIDVMEVWLGNKKFFLGHIQKPNSENEYTVYGEFGKPLFLVQKSALVSSTTKSKRKLETKYTIRDSKNGWIKGEFDCSKKKKYYKKDTKEYPFSVDLNGEMSLVDRALLFGTFFFVASRVATDRSKILKVIEEVNENENPSNNFEDEMDEAESQSNIYIKEVYLRI